MHYENGHSFVITYSDQHYKLVVYEKIMQLVKTFRTYVLDLAKDDKESLLVFISSVSCLLNCIQVPRLISLQVTRDDEWRQKPRLIYD